MSKDKKPTPPVPIRKDELHKAAEKHAQNPDQGRDSDTHRPPRDKPKK